MGRGRELSLPHARDSGVPRVGPLEEQGESRFRALTRRVAGWGWIAAWAAALRLVASPWRDLGGLVDERLRWLERVVLGAGLMLGWLAGTLGRRAARPGTGRSHATLLRRLLLPVGALAAAGMLALRLADKPDPIGVVFTAFLAFWAGTDVAFGAWPLVTDRSYGFSTPIEPAGEEETTGEDPADPPQWMGL